MEKLSINFENCYGIKKLSHTFDFSKGCAHVIYAPNGAMKSSFAKIFDDISKNQKSRDRVFSERTTNIQVKCNDNDEIVAEKIFAIERYKENYSSDKLSTLLVNQTLKNDYQDILNAIDEKKDILVKALKSSSGLKGEIAAEFTKTFNMSEKDFLKCLELVEDLVSDESEVDYSEIIYTSIFNEKVLEFLKAKDFKTKLEEYMNVYDQLVNNSTYFKKGVFNHNNADTVSKTLKTNGFFAAKHSVSLNNGSERKELNSQEELDLEINNEKYKILNNDDLAKKFKAIDDAIIKNINLRDFRNYLENNIFILSEIHDLDKFKKKVWCSYLKKNNTDYYDLLNLYKTGKTEIEKIIIQAKQEETSWKEVVDIFNKRFSVPYRILVKNQDEVILKGIAPNVVFEYLDGTSTKEIGGRELIGILSTGEQRALYLLNIIFEIEVRKNEAEKTLLIIDDIADSFDYKNKYAIIEYLKDILDSNKFITLILTHNFDFYRTIISRLSIDKWHNCLITTKNETEVSLICGKDKLDIFSRLKNKYDEDDLLLIACVPFVRNLIEYTIGQKSAQYQTLTALLHVKPEKTKDSITTKGSIYITINDLELIFNDIFRVAKPLKNGSKSVLQLTMELSEKLSTENIEDMGLEKKLVLSIGIRLQAEGFMIDELNNKNITDDINSFQTAKLLKLYKEKFPTKISAIKVLEQVNLMTSENIHINSFMYEPLLDISDHHLKTLYKDVKSLIVPV